MWYVAIHWNMNTCQWPDEYGQKYCIHVVGHFLIIKNYFENLKVQRRDFICFLPTSKILITGRLTGKFFKSTAEVTIYS